MLDVTVFFFSSARTFRQAQDRRCRELDVTNSIFQRSLFHFCFDYLLYLTDLKHSSFRAHLDQVYIKIYGAYIRIN